MVLHNVVWLFPVGVLILGADGVFSQPYPNKPIRIIAGAVGAGNDSTARLIAQGISGPLGQRVIVENRGTVSSAEITAKATPDGYTLLVSGSNLWVAPLMQNMSYDPVKDFLPISMIDRTPNIIVVNSAVPANSVKELIALAKAKSGELNYAAGQLGTTAHLAGELLKAMAGINIVGVPYKGSAANIAALLGGEVQIAFGQPTLVAPHLKSGRLRALAIATAEPSALFPGLPTVAATLPGYESVQSQGMFAPAKTPAAIVNRLNQESVRFLKSPETREKILSTGSEAVGNSSEQFAAAIRSEMVRLRKVIKDVGIKVE